MNFTKEKPVVGIIFDKRGDPPYISVGKLWSQTAALTADKFQTEIFEVEGFFVENNREYLEFIDKIDILMMLSPYYSIDRTSKRFPVVAYGLGSMQKGGHWIFDNQNSFRNYDSIILNCTACQNISNLLMNEGGVKTHLIPFGVNTDVFYPRGDKLGLRKKYGIPDDAFVMVYSGRISIQKNAHLLAGLLRELEKEHKNIYLVVIGFFDNFYIPEFSCKLPPDSKTEFYKLIDEFNLQSKIKIFNNQNDPDTYAEMLSMADIGINLTTLISENFGYTPVEMQACGLPVIGTDWGGLKDTIIDGETGFHIPTVLSEHGTRINLKTALSRISQLVNDKGLLEKMKIKARNNAEKKYAQDLFTQNVQKIILSTYDNFKSYDREEYPLRYNPIIESLSHTLHRLYGGTRHVSWEHLHPLIDSQHYKLIASECATEKCEDITWSTRSHISKGFDWKIKDDRFISYDPRWNTSFELVNWSITDKELFVLKLIDYFDYTVQDILGKEKISWEELCDVLMSLTRKGLIVPFYYKEDF